MPGAADGERYRFVVDEVGFDFRGLADDELTGHLDAFNDMLDEVLRRYPVGASPWWSETECADGHEMWRFLYEREGPYAVSPDVRRRLALLMDRCSTWDSGAARLPDRVEVAGSELEAAWSVGYAMHRAWAGHATACLVLPAADRSGWLAVTCEEGGADVFFLSGAPGITHFWRGTFRREDVPESVFFDRAREAFPELEFAPGLTFRKFDGTYREMREWVVDVLGVLNDHFAGALAAHSGQPQAVQAELGRFGLDLSPESPNTRGKPRIMRQRKVEHEGQTYDCEWHAKKERHRNRVHFTLPEQRLGGRILVGIFTDHLDT
ncbi:hypothetical protein ACG5V6_17095 [Streptomyces chitinivorans]|uniref:Barstar (barnase inhibitor) domain-containing protein n=1 Tax=Streptomyces chitinivorans TaxID=1257027 RepID=A0ABW7HVK6_9ACTN|nr:hypothetical protein [Streptomyces chitinivorans]MDH2410543.1 hypothetical protein [Streptomyces chitinivorans]